jgi:signal transduction histidine kinase
MRSVAIVIAALALVAVVELASGLGWPQVVGDAAAGAALLAAGGLAALRRDGRRAGLLLVLAGAAWLAGAVEPTLAALHRGPLVHALLSVPGGRVRSPVAIAATGAAYVSGAFSGLANTEWVTVAAAALLLLATADQRRGRSLGRPPLTAETVAFAGALVLGAIASGSDLGLEDIALWTYYLTVTGVAIAVPVRLASSRWTGAALSGLVADLGELDTTDALRHRLARAIGDPDLAVGYRLDSNGTYADATGAPLRLPDRRSARTVTEVSEEGEVVAVLVHDRATLEDPAVRAAVASTARLAVANTRLHAQVIARTREVAASRRRIVEAADNERRQLETELRASAGRRLDTVAEWLGARTDDSLSPIAAELDRARIDLARLARGLHPAKLTEAGIAAAVQDLAAAAAVPVSVDAPDARFPAAVEAAAYFVCAEAMANAAKHAQCHRIGVQMTADARTLRVDVVDDGRGGAVAIGSGLLGLGDRVEALGGRLSVESDLGAGTRVTAELPLP